jgi:hypothetical protein
VGVGEQKKEIHGAMRLLCLVSWRGDKGWYDTLDTAGTRGNDNQVSRIMFQFCGIFVLMAKKVSGIDDGTACRTFEF